MDIKPQERKFKRTLTGEVVSDKCKNTLVVKVVRRFRHAKYNKFVHASKKYYVHTEVDGVARIGDKVSIIESRPHSRLKRWELLSEKGSDQ
ncbi:MAG: 30S ribosomal protein S17 [Oligoflexia bacterium]|nr:30S ribosomal protein S17 [Oligoflexia bacterium]